ncbi:hypothetical protein AEAC466_19075 [Asticcacaulis sp. AC466]|uniref:TetR/AcrR family transcriptional regulator n=1 Tax=Asticcacaulis sp. AC466 TaxID=1282362 RepID=UPI0003C3D765|nr:TetR/AcrR family transcriptional regulator [Asticcacaulis sp. AC466]ESQ82022.1 hypothetical protein AEAC466_19075 [Asticcacaulis sp. AC466]
MSKNSTATAKAPGLRERKRRETLQRITDAGMRLFIEKGYEATTLDDIATAAGISRRTFFYYFDSKDEILLSMQSTMGDMIVAALRKQPDNIRPIEAVRNAVIEICAPFSSQEMMAIDRLMRANAVVQARKQASYIHHERTLFDALCEKWPGKDRETGLRIVAMLSIGAIRLSTEALNREEGKRSLAELLADTFHALEREL